MITSKELQSAVMAYASGNKESFTQIYELSYPYLHTCVIHVVKNEDLAMDMLQETYIEISKNILQLENTNMFLNWAATIANRKCFAYLRKQRDVLCDTEDSEEYFENIADDANMIPEELLQDREKQRLIRGIIDELTDLQRLCVIGFYYNDQKQDEIAEELGIPVNTVKSHLNRAKNKIKEAVIELDVKKGTRLYSFAPFMLLVFNVEALTCQVPAMGGVISAAVGLTGATATGATASTTAGATVTTATTTSVSTATATVTAKSVAASATTGAVKAAGMALKTKIVLGLAGVGAAALIGGGAYVGLNQPDELPSAKEAEQEEITYSFPTDFQSWDTASRNLAGENRYLYADGNKITMPTTVGEWEELLSTEFVDVPSCHSGGTSNYTYNQVGVTDENGIEFVFRIDTASYVPIESDMEAELAQLRNTPVVGIQIICWGEDSGINSELRSYISLIEDGSMFDEDIDEVNEAIADEYDVEISDNSVTVDRFMDGYMFTWTWSEDGDTRKLEIEYVPEHLLAFYQYLHDARVIDWENKPFSEKYDKSEIECALADVTYDGFDELVIDTADTRAILAYDWHTGELTWLTTTSQDRIRLNSVMVDIRSFYADGTSEQGEDRFAKYVRRNLYVYNIKGDELPLVSMTQYNDGSTYCINDKVVSKETYDACWNMYWDANLVGMFDGSDFVEQLKNSVGTHYAGLRSFKDKINNGEGLKVYDDSTIAEVSGDVEAWKENYVSLIQEYISGSVAMDGGLVAIQFDHSQTMEEQLFFNVQDINGDGLPELFLHYEEAYGSDTGYFDKFHLFLPKGSWNNSRLGVFDMIDVAGTELVEIYDYSLADDVNIYHYDGSSQTFLMRISHKQGEILVGSEYVPQESYSVYDGEDEWEISYEEYVDLVNLYTQGEKQQIASKKLTIENLEEALDIRIYQLDSMGYKIGPIETNSTVETTEDEQSMPEAAQSAQQAYEEFLSGERKAIVDSRYSSGFNAPMLFLQGETISLTEMSARVLDSYYGTNVGRGSRRSEADWQREMQYAYIDCGGDDEKELAIKFWDENPHTSSGEYENICVLKYRDGQLYITYNIFTEHLRESDLYQNGLVKVCLIGAEQGHYGTLEVLDRSGIRCVVYEYYTEYRVFKVDSTTGEWEYYDDLSTVCIYTINGMQYCTIECADGYDYDVAVEHALEYLNKIGKGNVPLVEQSEVDEILNELNTRYHISDETDGISITWTDVA